MAIPHQSWSNYGYNSTEWDGRAADNVQRIDLRDWLYVVIDNRRAIEEASGDEFDDDSDQKTGTAG